MSLSDTDHADEIPSEYEDALDDVHTRFILNLPPEELASSDRIFFQLEQAWWFYDDFYCDKSDGTLPRFPNVRQFARTLFDFSPILKPRRKDFDKMWAEFSKYKRSISTYGSILLNTECTKIILCQVYNSQTWTFPAGKVNQNENGASAAARETYEETGFDPNCELGLTKQIHEKAQEQDQFLPWKPLNDDDGLFYMDSGKRRTCYVCRGVPETFPFSPVARKEVSAIEWHDLDEIPKKTFAVLPFMGQLRRWIKQNTRSKTPKKTKKKDKNKEATPAKKRSGSTKKSGSRNNSRGRDSRGRAANENDSTVVSGLASVGDENGWTEEDMFKANEKLLGKRIEYDGNPHVFAERGFDGKQDPHAFHVVGGSFMNSGEGIANLAHPPDKSKLQPLFRSDDSANDGDKEFQPFFSSEGESPWGDIVSEALSEEAAAAAAATKKQDRRKDSSKKRSKKEDEAAPLSDGKALLTMLQGGGTSSPDEVFMTDKEITARSQKEKIGAVESKKDKGKGRNSTSVRTKDQETADYIKEWVKNLPRSEPTKRFGDFRFNVDAIMNAMEGKA